MYVQQASWRWLKCRKWGARTRSPLNAISLASSVVISSWYCNSLTAWVLCIDYIIHPNHHHSNIIKLATTCWRWYLPHTSGAPAGVGRVIYPHCLSLSLSWWWRWWWWSCGGWWKWYLQLHSFDKRVIHLAARCQHQPALHYQHQHINITSAIQKWQLMRGMWVLAARIYIWYIWTIVC